MCRLYGMQATHPTRVACELIDAQNSLIKQAARDERGLENPHGWGIGLVQGDRVECARQVGPAHESEEYRAQVMASEAETVVAHVRRATVGEPCHENTHPFRWQDSFLSHNGHIGRFDEVKPRLLDALSSERREAIGGTTDSEHFFQLVLSTYLDEGADSRGEALQRAVETLVDCRRELDEDVELALNTLWVHDGDLMGTKLERSLWYVERGEPIECGICDEPHAEPDDGRPYRSTVLASERITDENWTDMPDGSIFWLDSDGELHIEPMRAI